MNSRNSCSSITIRFLTLVMSPTMDTRRQNKQNIREANREREHPNQASQIPPPPPSSTQNHRTYPEWPHYWQGNNQSSGSVPANPIQPKAPPQQLGHQYQCGHYTDDSTGHRPGNEKKKRKTRFLYVCQLY